MTQPSTCTDACTCQRGGDDRGSVSRRGVLAGSAAVAAAMALAACSSADDASTPSSPTPEPASSEPPSADPTAQESASPASGGSGEVLATVDEFPVGGGKVVPDTSVGPVVVTHPEDDVYLAFTGVCTHQSCTVAEVLENTINCNCHGSAFDGSSGDVVSPPATRGLAEIPIQVSGGEISLA